MTQLTGSGNFIPGTKPDRWREYTSAYSVKLKSSNTDAQFTAGSTADTATGLTGTNWKAIKIGDVISVSGVPAVVTMTYEGQPTTGFGQSRSPTVNLEENELIVDLGVGRTYICNVYQVASHSLVAGERLTLVYDAGAGRGAFSTNNGDTAISSTNLVTAGTAIILDDVAAGNNVMTTARVLFR